MFLIGVLLLYLRIKNKFPYNIFMIKMMKITYMISPYIWFAGG